jgi:hypothetical protein
MSLLSLAILFYIFALSIKDSTINYEQRTANRFYVIRPDKSNQYPFRLALPAHFGIPSLKFIRGNLKMFTTVKVTPVIKIGRLFQVGL